MTGPSDHPFDKTEAFDNDAQSAKEITENNTTEWKGQSIGPFRILEILGEGGMGVVYLAEQRKPIKRQVALKIIKAGMDTKQVLGRFDAERQALALMNHENVAKVLDAGTTDSGLPYFAMELVRGIPITEFCDRHKLDINARLDLFRQVCNAVQHAHQKGVIHRDLKPSNILVTTRDDKPVPKVIDFGLAKATSQPLTEQTMFTGHGQILGTPEYMSPEQTRTHEQDIDTRTDIYSLGVILYELLTGTTPLKRESFKNAALAAILNRIQDEEPERPSSRLEHSGESLQSISSVRRIDSRKFTLLMKGELDWVVMKAIEKERSRRYETASEFAADISRFLNEEPVLARPPSASYRIRKFARKNRGLVASLAAIVCLLAAGVIGTSWGLMWALEEREIAVAEQTRADEEATRANKNRKLAESRTEAAQEAETAANEARQQAESTAARSDFLLAMSRYRDGSVGEAADLLSSIPADQRDVEWKIAQTLVEGTPSIHFAPQPVIACEADLNSNCILTIDKAGAIWQYDCDSGEIQTISKLSLESGDWVAWADFVDDQRKVVVATIKNRVGIWDFQQGQKLDEIRMSGFDARFVGGALTASHDGKTTATPWSNGRFDSKSITIWELESGSVIQELQYKEDVEGMLFHPANKSIAVLSGDLLSIVDSESGETLYQRRLGPSMDPSENGRTNMSYSASGAMLSITNRNRCQVLDSTLTDIVFETPLTASLGVVGYSNKLPLALFSPCESKIAILGCTALGGQPDVDGAGLNRIFVQDLSGSSKAQEIRLTSTLIRTASFAPDGQYLVSCGSNRQLLDGRSLAKPSSIVKFWPLSQLGGIHATDVDTDEDRMYREEFLTIRHSPSGRYVALFAADDVEFKWAGTVTGTVFVFDTKSQREILKIPNVTPSFDFTGDSTCLLVVPAGGRKGIIRRWDMANRTRISDIRINAQEITNLRCHPRTSSFFTLSKNAIPDSSENNLVLSGWDLTGKRLGSTPVDAAHFTNFAISPHGDMASGLTGRTTDKTIFLWDIENFVPRREISIGLDFQMVIQLMFTSDNRSIVASDNIGRLTFWDCSTGQVTRTGRWANRFSFIPNSSRILCSGVSGLAVVDPDADLSSELIKLNFGSNEMVCVSADPNGEGLAAYRDGKVFFWEWGSEVDLLRLLNHPSPVVIFRIDEANDRILTLALDGKLRIWHPDSDQPMGIVSGFSPNVNPSMRLSPDGKILAFTGLDPTRKKLVVHGVELDSQEVVFTLDENGFTPSNFTFSRDSRSIRLEDTKSNTSMVVDARDGSRISTPPGSATEYDTEPKSNDRYYAIVRGNSVRLYGLENYSNNLIATVSNHEAANWHSGLADRRAKEGQRGAVAFHRAWALHYQPDSTLVYEQFQQALAALEQAGDPPPEIALQVLAQTKPELTESELQWIRDRWQSIGDAVYASDFSFAESDIAQLRILARHSESVEDQLRLAAAEYRLGQVESANQTLAALNIDELTGKQAILARFFDAMLKRDRAKHPAAEQIARVNSLAESMARYSKDFDSTCDNAVQELLALLSAQEPEPVSIAPLKQQQLLSLMAFEFNERRKSVDAGWMLGRPPVNLRNAIEQTDFFQTKIDAIRLLDNLSGVQRAQSLSLRAFCFLMLDDQVQASSDLADAASENIPWMQRHLESQWGFLMWHQGDHEQALKHFRNVRLLAVQSKSEMVYEDAVALATLELMKSNPERALAALPDHTSKSDDLLPLTIRFLIHVRRNEREFAERIFSQLQSKIELQRKSESETLSYYRASEANYHFVDCLKYSLDRNRKAAWHAYLKGLRWMHNRKHYRWAYRDIGVCLLSACQDMFDIEHELTQSVPVAIETAAAFHFEADDLEAEPPIESVTVRQDNMLDFGPYWTEDAYRLWANEKRNNQLKLKFEVPVEGKYRVFVRATGTLNFGIVSFAVDGMPAGGTSDLYNAMSPTSSWGVTCLDEVDLGTVQLEAGTHSVTITCKSRNFASREYGAGIDYFSIWPAEIFDLDSVASEE